MLSGAKDGGQNRNNDDWNRPYHYFNFAEAPSQVRTFAKLLTVSISKVDGHQDHGMIIIKAFQRHDSNNQLFFLNANVEFSFGSSNAELHPSSSIRTVHQTNPDDLLDKMRLYLEASINFLRWLSSPGMNARSTGCHGH
ncbi:hypothetical protein O9929_19580 [Vibrio lentus]|nr:hypothetical protein [Vibrio lentus]